MKLSYDPTYNVAYIQLREKPDQIDTIQIKEEVNLDVAADGTLYGIELLNANEQLGAALVVEGVAEGQLTVRLTA